MLYTYGCVFTHLMNLCELVWNSQVVPSLFHIPFSEAPVSFGSVGLVWLRNEIHTGVVIRL